MSTREMELECKGKTRLTRPSRKLHPLPKPKQQAEKPFRTSEQHALYEPLHCRNLTAIAMVCAPSGQY